jgi:hypothetical protein
VVLERETLRAALETDSKSSRLSASRLRPCWMARPSMP